MNSHHTLKTQALLARAVINVFLIAILFLLSCATASNHRAFLPRTAGPLSNAIQTDGGSALEQAIPLPASLVVRTSSAIESRIKSGAGYNQVLASSQVTIEDTTSLRFTPDWVPGQEGTDGLAFAIYQFTLISTAGLNQLHLTWDNDAHPDEDTAWVGLSHWNSNAWRWLPVSAGVPVPVPQLAQYVSGETMLVCVMLTGVEETVLEWLRIGDNAPPVIELVVDNAEGRAPREVVFDAAGSTDLDGSIASFEWDWLADGVFDLSLPGPTVETHTYYLGGPYTVAVKATDNDGQSATATFSFELNEHTDWWCHGRDRRNTRRCPYPGPQELSDESEPVWTFDLVDGPINVLLGADGTVYSGSRAGVLYAIDPVSGTETGRFEHASAYIRLRMIGPDGSVYALVALGSPEQDNYVVALDAGLTEKWRITGAEQARDFHGIDMDGAVLVSFADNWLKALDPATREARRSYQAPDAPTTMAAIDADGSVYFGGSSTSAYGVYPDWTFRAEYWVRDDLRYGPTISDAGLILAPPRGYYVCGFTPDGDEEWIYKVESSDDIETGFALGYAAGEERIYFGNEDSCVYSIRTDGSLGWRCDDTPGEARSIIVAGDDKIYYTIRGDVVCIKANKNPKWRFDTGYTSPVVHAISADGTLYVSTQGNYSLYAYHDE